MNMKWIGAALLIIACTVFGFLMACSVQIEIRNLRDLIKIINYMECELNFRLTPLGNLCKLAAPQGKSLQAVFDIFAEEMDNQISPDPARCMDAALIRSKGLSQSVIAFMRDLGNSFGKFDLQGQLAEMQFVHQRCIDQLQQLEMNKDVRVRNCQTIGFCVGVAITIILL